MNELLSLPQLLGYLALLVAIIGVLQTNDIKLKLWMIAGYVVLASHYVVLGSMVTAGVLLIGILRNIVALKYHSLWIALTFSIIYFAMGIMMMSSPIDLLPVIGASINTIAIVTLQGIKMRVVLIVSSFFGIANAVVVGSIGGLAIESMLLVFGLVTLYRLFKRRHRTNQADLNL
ncbi:hypothetical protein BIY21_03950 [Vibrio ponticus]|uniref:YgjV family protein n=1 Tax=Vibrio ponticus TaxID=265668 RepID=A0ABX3FAI9_9VIBR|nr:YgjV family protein [Vibrio ponticus]OLQ86593.1 hypothetical protein BIY21_03950 [Vibrio ponticus]